MCPNHIEPIAEEKLLCSSSFSERIQLWHRFSKPIDHESIKSNFLYKIMSDSESKPNTSKQLNDTDTDSSNLDEDELEDETEEIDDFCRSRIHDALNQMIESSKILDALENDSINGDIESGQANSNLVDKNTKDKREWIEFLIKLSNSGAKQDSKSTRTSDISVKEDPTNNQQTTQPNDHQGGSIAREGVSTKVWTNNVLAPKNRNTNCRSKEEPQMTESMSKSSRYVEIIMRNKQ